MNLLLEGKFKCPECHLAVVTYVGIWEFNPILDYMKACDALKFHQESGECHKECERRWKEKTKEYEEFAARYPKQ